MYAHIFKGAPLGNKNAAGPHKTPFRASPSDYINRRIFYVPAAGKTLRGLTPEQNMRRQRKMTKVMGQVMTSPIGGDAMSTYRRHVEGRATKSDFERAMGV